MTSDATWSEAMTEAYDRAMGPVIFQPYAQRIAALASGLKPRRILEIAAGSGIATAAIIKALPASAVTATDLNDAMVSYGAGQVPGATWQAADAQDLPFADASFDLIVCQFGVMFFPDKVAAFAQMARVLAPGGRCLLAIWDVLAACEFEAALTESLAVVLPDDPPSFLARVPHGYADTTLIRADVTAGGLEVEAIDRLVETSAAPSAAFVAEGFCHGSPLRFTLEQRGSLPELTELVATELTKRLGPGPIEGQMAAFVVTARKP